MADIKQAAKWMQEGKTVRRHEYATEWWMDTWRPQLLQICVTSADDERGDHELNCQDLLADDWELA